MNLKSANRWQNILLFGGFVIGMVGIAVLDNLYIAILGLAMMAMSIVVWWMYPVSYTHLTLPTIYSV